jgi:hypothetical protein
MLDGETSTNNALLTNILCQTVPKQGDGKEMGMIKE